MRIANDYAAVYRQGGEIPDTAGGDSGACENVSPAAVSYCV